MSSPTTYEPAPMPNDLPAVWDMVIEDMRARDAMGRAKYGTPLQPFNGRDALWDSYQESLDLCVYLRQAIYERDKRMEKKYRVLSIAELNSAIHKILVTGRAINQIQMSYPYWIDTIDLVKPSFSAVSEFQAENIHKITLLGFDVAVNRCGGFNLSIETTDGHVYVIVD